MNGQFGRRKAVYLSTSAPRNSSLLIGPVGQRRSSRESTPYLTFQVVQYAVQAPACVASKAVIRCSRSVVAIARRHPSKKAASGVASSGRLPPRTTASTRAP